MTNQIKLHVGYVGKTRDGKRVEIVDSHDIKGYMGDNGSYYWFNGVGNLCKSAPTDIIAPWVDEPALDYNDGKWHGWNGGECPVHPKSKIDANNGRWAGFAAEIDWQNFRGALRVLAAHVEPQKPREFWLKLTNTGHGIPTIHDHFAGGAIHVREVLDI